MESPSIWDLVTGSLAVCDLGKPASAWAFLVVQGLVRNEPGDREAFLAILSEEQARGEITGPSVELRMAGSLKRAGITLPAALVADPWGATALRRVDIVAAWGIEAAGQSRDERRNWLQSGNDP